MRSNVRYLIRRAASAKHSPSKRLRRALLWTCALAVVASMLPSAPTSAAKPAESGNPSATLSQCANGSFSKPDDTACQSANEWVNGNLGASKAHYFEGESIPYRMVMDNLTTGTGEHNLIIEWDTTKQGKHALDYLTSWDHADSVKGGNPCAGTSVSCASPDVEPIPADPQVTAAGVTQAPGEFELYGGDIKGLSTYRYPLGEGFAGDKSAQITITFTASIKNPILAWGGHIASQADWEAGNSAISIPGSPYHTRLIDLDGSGGNQDRSLATAAVAEPPAPATIRIIKDAVPNDPQDFDFTADGGLSPATFVLDDDDDPTASNIQDFSVAVAAGATNSYTVSETLVAGWTASVSCVESNNPKDTTTSGATAEIKLQSSESVTCTFTNTQQDLALTVTKVATPDSLPEPGGEVSYEVTVTNDSEVTVTLTSLIDDKFGDLNGQGDCVLPADIAPGDSFSCTFLREIEGDPDTPHTNTVTATVTDGTREETGQGTETVTFTGVDPKITVVKDGPATIEEPGGLVTYDVTVSNDSEATDPVTITMLFDNVVGELEGDDDCQIGTVLQPGQSCSFSFTAEVTGSAGTSVTNIVTVTVKDDENVSTSDDDDHTVTIVCVPVPGDPAGATANGNAYAAKVFVPGLIPIDITLPDPIATSSQAGVGDPPADENSVLDEDIAGIVALQVLSAGSDAEITTARATDHSEATVAKVNLLGGTVVAEAVTASATANATDAGASTGSFDSTIAKLTVAGVGVVDVKPGAVVNVPGVGTLYVYERNNHVDPTNPNVADLTVNMLRLVVTLGPLNGTEIIVSHAEAHAKFPAAKFCGARPQGTVSGDAAIANILINPPLLDAHIVTAGPLPESGGSDLAQVALVGPVFFETTKLIGAQAATAKTEGAFDGHQSASQSQAEVASAELLKMGLDPALISAQAIESHTSSVANDVGAASEGSTTLVNLTINGTNVCIELGLGPVCEPPPNTDIVTDLVLIRLNEQIEDTSGNSTDITVNAIHIFVLGEGNPFGLPVGADIVVARSHSDACYDASGTGACSTG
jgi:hypothetical protein